MSRQPDAKAVPALLVFAAKRQIRCFIGARLINKKWQTPFVMLAAFTKIFSKQYICGSFYAIPE